MVLSIYLFCYFLALLWLNKEINWKKLSWVNIYSCKEESVYLPFTGKTVV